VILLEYLCDTFVILLGYSWDTFGYFWVYCPPRNHTGIIGTGKIRPNIKFGAYWCVFLTKIKVDPESW
jgi:hypothetical protein